MTEDELNQKAIEELREKVAPYIVGAKRVAVRVAALRRLLAAYDALSVKELV